MKAIKSGKFWVSLVLFSLVGQIAWVVENMYFNVFIYNMFGATEKQISFMVGASSVVATLTTIFIGALSDRIGRRKIFISLGYILWGVSILAFALVRQDIIAPIVPAGTTAAAVCITITIILDCLMTFFGSTANDACFNAWLTDITEENSRGKVEGINAMMPLMAILVVFGGFMGFDLKDPVSWTTIFIIIGAVVVVIGIASFFLIKEVPIASDTNKNYLKNIIYSFRPSTVKSNVILYVGIIAFAIFNISIQIFMPYLILYYEQALSLKNYVLIMAPAIIIAGIVTAVYGRVYDKFGFTIAILPAMGSLMLGYILLICFTNTVMVFIGSLFMMTGYLAGMAVFGAMIRDRTPKDKAGALQGLRIVGQVLIPGIVGPAIGAAVLSGAERITVDGVEKFIPNINIFIAAAVAAIVALGAIWLLHFIIKKAKTKEQTNTIEE